GSRTCCGAGDRRKIRSRREALRRRKAFRGEGAETQSIRQILQRLLYTLPALWLILTMVFLMIPIVPGDPVLQMLGQDARVEDLAQLRHSLGLDQPLGVQYVRYF